MSSDTLREYINRMPFHPISLFLPSGRVITVSNPELTLFSETGRTLIVTEGDKFIFIDVATVEAAETLAD